MDLIPIKDYEGLYSLDKNTNQIYNTKYNRYLKANLGNDGYYKLVLSKNNKQKTFRLHRLIYQAYNLDIDITNLEIDHIDNNKSNNNIENLRKATISENRCNVSVQKNKLSTAFKNIRKTKCNTYQVQINKDKKKYSKSFKTLEEAILWRDIKLIELHGEFHNLG
tara:strand:- start:1467 stop:1961 length:495 start_codon:yes stop_codon:yes gene_type:complete